MSKYFSYDKNVNHRELDENRMYIGIEIESVRCFDELEDQDKAEGVINLNDGSLETNTWSLVYDGSSNVGAEYVSQCLLPGEVEAEIKELYSTGLIEADEGNGQHIHFTRSEVGKVTHLMYLSCYLADDFYRISGREYSDIMDWAALPIEREGTPQRYDWLKTQDWEENRYVFLNTQNYNTVEYRFFNTTDYEREAVLRIKLLQEVIKANRSLSRDYELEELNDEILQAALDKTEYNVIIEDLEGY